MLSTCLADLSPGSARKIPKSSRHDEAQQLCWRGRIHAGGKLDTSGVCPVCYGRCGQGSARKRSRATQWHRYMFRRDFRALRRAVQGIKVVLTRRCFTRLYRKLGINHPRIKRRLVPAQAFEIPAFERAMQYQRSAILLLCFNVVDLVALLDVAFLALCIVDLRRLSNDSGFETTATLLGTECSGDSNSKCNDSGHDGFEEVSGLLHCTPS